MNTPSIPQSSALSRALRLGLSSAKENALPGFILWIVASAIIAGYYHVPAITRILLILGEIKAASGYMYAAVATALFGGTIPFLWKLATQYRKRTSGAEGHNPWNVAPWKAGVFLTIFWCWKGIEIDFFYRLQSVFFGYGATPGTIIPKVLVDQFVYNPLWAGWTQILAYWWLDQAFRKKALADPVLWKSIGSRLVTILMSTWGVWIPMVTIIYSMPPNLQVPLFNIALCFWGLMLASLTKEKQPQPGERP